MIIIEGRKGKVERDGPSFHSKERKKNKNKSLYKSILKIELIKEMALYYDNNIATHMETHNNFSLKFHNFEF
jgi:hypothetical protein